MIARNSVLNGGSEPDIPPSGEHTTPPSYRYFIPGQQTDFSSRIHSHVPQPPSEGISNTSDVTQSESALPEQLQVQAQAVYREFRLQTEREFDSIVRDLPKDEQPHAMEQKSAVVTKVLRILLQPIAVAYLGTGGETLSFNPSELRATIRGVLKGA